MVLVLPNICWPSVNPPWIIRWRGNEFRLAAGLCSCFVQRVAVARSGNHAKKMDAGSRASGPPAKRPVTTLEKANVSYPGRRKATPHLFPFDFWRFLPRAHVFAPRVHTGRKFVPVVSNPLRPDHRLPRYAPSPVRFTVVDRFSHKRPPFDRLRRNLARVYKPFFYFRRADPPSLSWRFRLSRDSDTRRRRFGAGTH